MAQAASQSIRVASRQAHGATAQPYRGSWSLQREVARLQRFEGMRRRARLRASRRTFLVPSIDQIEMRMQLSTFKVGLLGAIDGAKFGLSLSDHAALDHSSLHALAPTNLPDLDVSVFPYVTALTTALREGRHAWEGRASWSTAALNTAVATSAVTSGSIAGAAVGSALLPGVGTVVGGFFGGLAGGMAGKWFAERKVRQAVEKYQQTKARWEPLIEASRAEVSGALEHHAGLVRKQYRERIASVWPRALVVPRLHWLAWCVSAALLWALGWLPGVNRVRSAALAALAAGNRQRLAELRREQRALRHSYDGLARRLADLVRSKCTAHAEKVMTMFTELNACYVELNRALAERGRARR